MICAYSELYLENARKVIAVLMDYAIGSLNFEPSHWYQLFSGSPAAKQFETGNPRYLAGMSGIELAHSALSEVGLELQVEKYIRYDRTPEYWMGWALSYYQWLKNIRFSEVLEFAEINEILNMYKKYHELDIRHFCNRLDQMREAVLQETNLKRLRRLTGYSQSILALKSGVPVRTIQQYEQKQKDINHAQAAAILSLAQALGCSSRDLLESQK